jgi:hypothetical protein
MTLQDGESIVNIIATLMTPCGMGVTAFFTWRVHRTAARNAEVMAHVSEISDSTAKVTAQTAIITQETAIVAHRTEINTNSLTKQLNDKTAEASFAAGREEGRANPGKKE